jgi:hypothetical protein
MPIAYLVRAETKKHLGDVAEESRICLVVPAPDVKLDESQAAGKAFELVAQVLHETSRYPVIEEASQRRVFVEDLRPFRNSLLREKDGWKCFGLPR